MPREVIPPDTKELSVLFNADIAHFMKAVSAAALPEDVTLDAAATLVAAVQALADRVEKLNAAILRETPGDTMGAIAQLHDYIKTSATDYPVDALKAAYDVALSGFLTPDQKIIINRVRHVLNEVIRRKERAPLDVRSALPTAQDSVGRLRGLSSSTSISRSNSSRPEDLVISQRAHAAYSRISAELVGPVIDSLKKAITAFIANPDNVKVQNELVTQLLAFDNLLKTKLKEKGAVASDYVGPDQGIAIWAEAMDGLAINTEGFSDTHANALAACSTRSIPRADDPADKFQATPLISQFQSYVQLHTKGLLAGLVVQSYEKRKVGNVEGKELYGDLKLIVKQYLVDEDLEGFLHNFIGKFDVDERNKMELFLTKLEPAGAQVFSAKVSDAWAVEKRDIIFANLASLYTNPAELRYYTFLKAHLFDYLRSIESEVNKNKRSLSGKNYLIAVSLLVLSLALFYAAVAVFVPVLLPFSMAALPALVVTILPSIVVSFGASVGLITLFWSAVAFRAAHVGIGMSTVMNRIQNGLVEFIFPKPKMHAADAALDIKPDADDGAVRRLSVSSVDDEAARRLSVSGVGELSHHSPVMRALESAPASRSLLLEPAVLQAAHSAETPLPLVGADVSADRVVVHLDPPAFVAAAAAAAPPAPAAAPSAAVGSTGGSREEGRHVPAVSSGGTGEQPDAADADGAEGSAEGEGAQPGKGS